MVGGASRVDGVGKGWFARGSPYWHKVSPGRILHCPASFQGVEVAKPADPSCNKDQGV